MLMDWVICGAVVSGIAYFLSKIIFKSKPLTKVQLRSTTVIFYFVNLVIMSIMKHFRYEALSDELGKSINPNNPLDFSGAFIMTFLAYSVLKSQSKTVELEDTED